MHDSLMCPLTLEIFRDPVVAEDGHCYEREAIIKWLQNHNTSPLTDESISIEGLRPSHTVKKLVNEFEQSNRSKNYQFKLGIDVKVKRRQALFHTFGKSIYEAEWINDDQNKPRIVLMKIDGARAKKEASFYVKLTCHPNIVRTFGFVDNHETDEEVTAVILLQEFASEGNLYEIVQDIQLNEKVLLVMFLQIIDAMIFLAYNGVVHGDLACRNVLVFRLTPDEPQKNIVKITDFGISRHSSLYAPTNTSARTTINIIPTRYAAPEVLSNEQYSEKSDVYSMGVLIWEAYSRGKIPWTSISSDDEVKRRVIQGEILAKPNNCSTNIWSVVQNCFTLNVTARPTFHELKNSLIQISSAGATNPGAIITQHIRNEVKELVRETKENTTCHLSIDIENLTIEECQVIMNEMKYNTSIIFFYISSKIISMEALIFIIESLKTIIHIKVLEFPGHKNDNSSTSLTGQIIHNLSELIKLTTTLTSIRFSGNRFANDQWAIAIANAIKTNQSITSIDMSDGQVGDIGAKAFGEMLTVNKHLEHLSLIYNHITEDGLIQLTNGLKKNRTLSYFNPGGNSFSFNSDANKRLLEVRRPGLIITHNCS